MPPRAPVVTYPGWPLKVAPRPVIVRPPQVDVRPLVPPQMFLPPVVFGGVVVGNRHERRDDRGRDRGRDRSRDRGYGYSRDSLVWQDHVSLYAKDDWTEFSLGCNALGAKLWYEVLVGRVQADWAEVVYENGEAQVVEFPKHTLGPGMYVLLNIGEGRRVDHIRMVAKTTSHEARLRLWMAR